MPRPAGSRNKTTVVSKTAILGVQQWNDYFKKHWSEDSVMDLIQQEVLAILKSGNKQEKLKMLTLMFNQMGVQGDKLIDKEIEEIKKENAADLLEYVKTKAAQGKVDE